MIRKTSQHKAAEKEQAETKRMSTTADMPQPWAKSAAPDPYKKKLAEIRKDLSTLIAKLRTHGIHVDLNSEAGEGEQE